MELYNPSKKRKKDPNAPKQPLSAYFLFQTEIRDKIKSELQNPSIYDVAKEVGKQWSNMAPEVKQRYQQMAEMNRRRYDQEMAAYLKGKSQNMSQEDKKVYDTKMTSYTLGNTATGAQGNVLTIVQGNNAIGGGIDPATTVRTSPIASRTPSMISGTHTMTPSTMKGTTAATTATKTEPAADVAFYRVLESSPGSRGEAIKQEDGRVMSSHEY